MVYRHRVMRIKHRHVMFFPGTMFGNNATTAFQLPLLFQMIHWRLWKRRTESRLACLVATIGIIIYISNTAALIILELKGIIVFATSIEPGQPAHLVWLAWLWTVAWPTEVFILISLKMIMDSSKNVGWITFSRLRINTPRTKNGQQNFWQYCCMTDGQGEIQ